MALQHFFVGGEYLGSRQIPDNRVVPGLEVRRHHSHALFCMHCGEIWGRILHEGAPLTQITCRPCLAHGDGMLGHWFYFSGDPHNYEDDWPKGAIRHEFQAILNHTIRKIEQP